MNSGSVNQHDLPGLASLLLGDVDDSEDTVARGLRLRRNNRQLLANHRIQQRALSRIGAAENTNESGKEGQGWRLLATGYRLPANILPTTSNDMDANAEPEVLPRPVRRVNGCTQGNSESQACSVSERQAERTGLDDEVSSGPGLLSGEGDRLVNGCVGGGPSVVWAKAPVNEFPVHFGKIDRAGRSPAHDLRRQHLRTRLAVEHGHQCRRIQHNPTHVGRPRAVQQSVHPPRRYRA